MKNEFTEENLGKGFELLNLLSAKLGRCPGLC